MSGQLVGELGDRREPALAQRRGMVGQPLAGALPSGGRHAVAHGRGSNGNADPGCRGAELVHQHEQPGEVLRWDGLELVDQVGDRSPRTRQRRVQRPGCGVVDHDATIPEHLSIDKSGGNEFRW